MREPNVLDEQIIKALESTMYTDEVRRAAYDLIMRQRREIEGLRMRIDALNHTNRILMSGETIYDVAAEYAALKKKYTEH
jgi:hypothetical protein